MLYASFVGSLTAVITSYDTHLGRQREALNSIRAFARHHGLSKTTQSRLVRNYEAYWAETNGEDPRTFITEKVPSHLSHDLLKELYAPLLLAMGSIEALVSPDTLFSFLSKLRTRVLISGDVLWHAGQVRSPLRSAHLP